MVFCPVNRSDVGERNVILVHHFREGIGGNQGTEHHLDWAKRDFSLSFSGLHLDSAEKETAASFKPNLNENIIYGRLQNAVDWGGVFFVCLHMMSSFNTCLCQARCLPWVSVVWPHCRSAAHVQLVVSPAQPLGRKDKALSYVFTSWLCFLLPPN